MSKDKNDETMKDRIEGAFGWVANAATLATRLPSLFTCAPTPNELIVNLYTAVTRMKRSPAHLTRDELTNAINLVRQTALTATKADFEKWCSLETSYIAYVLQMDGLGSSIGRTRVSMALRASLGGAGITKGRLLNDRHNNLVVSLVLAIAAMNVEGRGQFMAWARNLAFAEPTNPNASVADVVVEAEVEEAH